MPTFGIGHETRWDVIIKSYLLIWPQSGTELPILGAAWTLQHEMYFYILFGVTYFSRRLFVIISIAWILFILTSLVNGYDSFLGKIFNLLFFIGVSVAYICARKVTGRLGPLIFTIGCTGFLATGLWNSFVFDIGWNTNALLYGAFSALILYGAVKSEEHYSIELPAWVYFSGTSSYSIYLTHGAFLSVFSKIFVPLHLSKGITFVLVVCSTIACGMIFHLSVERPLNNWLRRFSPARRSKPT